jgi:hypothetical protein
VCPRLTEGAEGRADAVKPDPVGQERARVDPATGEMVERIAELKRRVAKGEADVDLLN